jgi:alanine-synthesizing transaminase
MDFSRRTAWDRRPNRISERLEALRRAGAPLIDLTESNPTRAGLVYPEAEILAALGAPANLRYEPDPRGLPSARVCLVEHLAAGGASVEPRQLVLTASTSEAYAYLFKLLCDPGDEVLIPSPCYPLFEFLTGLESVGTRTYPLRFDGAWRLDVDQLAACAGPRTRAVLLVNPGNPTGAFLKRDELAELAVLCALRGWAIISDEVFAEYGRGEDPERVRTVAGLELPALTFSLGGLSKLAGLPQLKLGWIVASGPEPLRDEALDRLELIADTYLSVNAPVQHALPRLLAATRASRTELRERMERNRSVLEAAHPKDAAWNLLPSEGGWYAVLRVPRDPPEEERCLALLERGVVVQPGYFFDFPGGAYLVVSLIVAPPIFDRGVELLVSALE